MAPRPEDSCESLVSLAGAAETSGVDDAQNSDQQGNRVRRHDDCNAHHHDEAEDGASVPSTGSSAAAGNDEQIQSQGIVPPSESQDDTKVAAQSLLSAATELAIQRSRGTGILSNPNNAGGRLDLPKSTRSTRSSRISWTTRKHSKISTVGDKTSAEFIETVDNNYDGDNDGGDDLQDDDLSSEGSPWIRSDDISIDSGFHPGAYRVVGPHLGIERRGSEDNVSIAVGSNLHDDHVGDTNNARTASIVLQGRTPSDDEASLRRRIHELEEDQRRHSAVALEVVGMYIDPQGQDMQRNQDGAGQGDASNTKVVLTIGWTYIFLCFVVVLTAIAGTVAGILLSKENVSPFNPTDAPSASTSHPTTSPTPIMVPSTTPTVSPTSTPTTTHAPTVDPINHLMDLLVSNNVSDPLVLSNPITPHYRAMEWLSNSTTGTKWLTAVDRTIERYVLALLFLTWGGGEGRWEYSKGWLSDENACHWVMLGCSNHGKNIAQLSLTDNGLSHTIPSEIGLLTNLRGLVLNGNELQGTLPSTISRLTNLRKLDLGMNQLSGKLPSLRELSNLEVLRLAQNDFEDNLNDPLCDPANNYSSGNVENFPSLKIFMADCRGDNPKIVMECSTYCNKDASEGEISGNTGYLCRGEEEDC